MNFSLAGVDQWNFQIVMRSTLLVLEALKDDLKLSTVLEPTP